MNARLAAYRRRECEVMAQEILDIDRDLNFSVSMTCLLWQIADGRIVPRNIDMRRVASAHARRVKAGLRQGRRAG